jgi:uncharacterized RDD family membrane protein YckC
MKNNSDLKYSSWSRIFSSLTYFFITWGIFNLLIIFFTYTNEDNILDNIFLWFNLSIILNIFFFVLNGVLYKFFGGDIGKIICGLKVQTADKENPSIRDFLFRELIGKTFSSLFGFLGYIYIFLNKNSQGFHDVLTETFVYRKTIKRIIAGTLTSLAFFIVSIFLLRNYLLTNNIFLKMQNQLDTIEIEGDNMISKNYKNNFQSIAK